MLQPAIDGALYAPVIWLCLFAVGASWLVAQHQISQTLVDRVLLGGYTFAVAIAGVLPLLRALKATFTFTPAVTTVERSTARMLRRILKGEAISEDLSYLREIASEGNLDTDHFQAALSLWLAARYVHDSWLAGEVRGQVERMLAIDRSQYESRWFWPQYVAWCVRMQYRIGQRPDLRYVLPPQLGTLHR